MEMTYETPGIKTMEKVISYLKIMVYTCLLVWRCGEALYK